MIVVTGGIKGGSGKTTLASNFAIERAKLGKKVLLVDADEQRSTWDWTRKRSQNKITSDWVTIQLSGETLWEELNKLRQGYDEIIVDTGGRDTTSQRAALVVCDVFISPFRPSSLDIWTVHALVRLLKDASAINRKLKAIVVINQGHPVGPDNKAAIDILKKEPLIHCLPFVIKRRVCYSNASAMGMGVSEMLPINEKAMHEMEQLSREVFGI